MVNIVVKVSGSSKGEQTFQISMADLAKLLQVPEKDIETVGTKVEQQGCSLETDMRVNDNDYPGVDVDGTSPRGTFYLANVELPNADVPHAFTARLYAGCSEYETDSPIAMVKSDIHGVGKNQKAFTEDAELTKIVYVDNQTAASRKWCGEWRGQGEEFPEHEEDTL